MEKLGRKMLVLALTTPFLALAACRSFARADELEMSPAGRQAVRGAPAPDLAESPRLRELRAYEEATFTASAPEGSEDAPPPPAWLEGLAPTTLPVRWDRRVVEFLRYYKEDPRGR